MMIITAVCAMSSNYVIGDNGKIPFDIPEDRRFFRGYCRYKLLVVGYKTFLGLPALPETDIFVLTDNLSDKLIVNRTVKSRDAYQNVHAGNMDALKALCSEHGSFYQVVIGGGGEVFKTFIPYLTHAHLTLVHEQANGDVKFPIKYLNELLTIKKESCSSYDDNGDMIWTKTFYKINNKDRKELVVN